MIDSCLQNELAGCSHKQAPPCTTLRCQLSRKRLSALLLRPATALAGPGCCCRQHVQLCDTAALLSPGSYLLGCLHHLEGAGASWVTCTCRHAYPRHADEGGGGQVVAGLMHTYRKGRLVSTAQPEGTSQST